MGDFEFDTSKVGKVNNARGGGYMITGENGDSRNDYERAKEDRLRQEKELVHREMHPLFHKTQQELREYDKKVSKEAEEQKRKSRELAGWNAPVETGEEREEESDDSEVIVVFGSAKKRRFKIFTRENTGKKKYGGWSEEGIDKMESLVKEIRVDRGEDPGNGRVGTNGSLMDRYWNFENAYFEWTNEVLGGHISRRKRKGQEQVKERQDNAIASLGSYRRKWLKKKQRKK